MVLTLSACGHKAARVSVPAVPDAVSASGDVEEGLASYYAEPYHGRKTANGETFDTYKGMTAAHRTLPFDTMVRVTNKTNGESVDVRINDRGPFVNGRIIDLSLVAAQKIEMVRAGVVPVKVQVLKEAQGGRLPMYAVQVGAFENQKSAEDLRSRLQRQFPSVSVQPFTGRNTTVFRVRIGSEPDMASAQKLASKLRKHDLNPFVVRVN